ncbi:MAG: nickel-dependent lactate racemase, partial [Candidatus Humimicrobiaceae bacterium]
MKITIPYGKEKIDLGLPENNILDIVSGGNSVSVSDEKEVVSRAIADPIGSALLSEIARGKTSACILASDITRPSPSYKFLPQLVAELESGGIELKNIRVVLGLGIHRGHTDDEKKKLVGDYIYKNIEVLDSDPSKAKLIGKTSAGTPVEVFEEVLESDLLIATGNIEYHYFAGYSGGAKAVMPGVCTRASIQANHSMMLDKRSASGNIKDNPVREDIEEAGKMAGIDFIFNVILDDSKNIIEAVAGKNNEAWLEGIKKYDAIYNREVESPADIVIVSPGGYPKDINLYQSQKALENIKDITKPGGVIILIASCSEGFGEDVFEEWMGQAKDYGAISKRLKKRFVLGGHKAVAVSRVIKDIKVYLHSEFDKLAIGDMGFFKLNDIQSYLNEAIKDNSNIKV